MSIMEEEVRMDVREAVEKARHCVAEFFAGEDISHVGVEEVVYDDAKSVWKVTIGFFRSWNRLDGLPASMYCAWDERSYKVVLIDDPSGDVGSMIHCTFTNMGIKAD